VIKASKEEFIQSYEKAPYMRCERQILSDSLMTVKDTADYLRVSTSTVYRYVEGLPYYKMKLGLRFRKEDVDVWLEKDKRKAITIPCLPTKQLTNLDTIVINKWGGISELAKAKSKTRYNFGYGAIYQRKTKSGKIRWYLDYRDADGRRVQMVANNAVTKDEAIVALREEVAKAFNKEYRIKREQEKIKFSNFTEMYIENYAKVNKRSWKDDQYRLQKFVDFLGNIYLHEVTPLEIEKFKLSKLKEGITKSTVNRYLAILKRMFNIAIDWGYAEENPVNRIKFYSEKDNLKERILIKEEEDRLLESSSEHLKPIIVVALNTGMRRSEISNMKWNQINLQTREIKVEKTKSGKIRIVDINLILFEELLRLKSKRKNSKYVFLNQKTKLQTSFEGACRRAQIEGLRFHDLRHTFASRLVEMGVDLIRIKEILGHSTVKITERYTHSNREEKKKAVELLCQKSFKKAKKREDLLHICDMEKDNKNTVVVSSLFSMN